MLYKAISCIMYFVTLISNRCLKQMKEMKRHLASVQKYVHWYKRSANCPLQFLTSIKTSCLPQIHLTLHKSHISINKSLNKEFVMEPLSGIQITESAHRNRVLAKADVCSWVTSISHSDWCCCMWSHFLFDSRQDLVQWYRGQSLIIKHIKLHYSPYEGFL